MYAPVALWKYEWHDFMTRNSINAIEIKFEVLEKKCY